MFLLLRHFIIPASSLLWEALLEIFLGFREILKAIRDRLVTLSVLTPARLCPSGRLL